MANELYANRVWEYTTTTGNSAPYALTGVPITGYQLWGTRFADGETSFYCAEGLDDDGNLTSDWEVGSGTYGQAGNTLARTEIIESSNNDLAVNWPTGSKRVQCTLPACYGVTNKMIRQSAALSVLGRSANSLGDAADIAGATLGHVLQILAGPLLGFGVQAFGRIEEQTPSSTGVVTFSSLGAFTHLLFAYSIRGTEAATGSNLNLTFNGDTGNNYDRESLVASAASPSAAEGLAAAFIFVAAVAAANAPAGVASGGLIFIPDYRGTTFNKGALSVMFHKTSTSSGGMQVRAHGGSWRNSAAITSAAMTLSAGNYATGCKVCAYGIL